MDLDNEIIRSDMENIYTRNIPWNRLNHKTVLVTGAYGMIASYFVFFLIYLNELKGMDIRIFAQGRNKEKMKKCFGSFCNRNYFTACHWDICEKIPNIGKFNYILHAASLANPRWYTKSPVDVARPNAIGTYQLLQYAEQCGVDDFLLLSSGDVYGQVLENEGYITENCMGIVDPLDIHSCYGESKRMAETWCKAFCHEKGISAKIARLAHTYGPNMDIENDPRVFASFTKCIVEGKDIVMLSDGTAKRAFCYAADAIAAFGYIIFKGEAGEAYNVCNEKEFMSIAELAEKLVKLESNSQLHVIKKERELEDTYLENKANRHNCLDATKLQKLGWECKYTTRMGFGKILQYLRKE